jgi:hypothetical protein
MDFSWLFNGVFFEGPLGFIFGLADAWERFFAIKKIKHHYVPSLIEFFAGFEPSTSLTEHIFVTYSLKVL